MSDIYIIVDETPTQRAIREAHEQTQKAISDADETIAALIEQIYLEDLEDIYNV